MTSSYAAGIVNHRSYSDLQRCLAGLRAQTRPPAVVVVVDHDPDFQVLDVLQLAWPAVVFDPRRNGGYAAGANRALGLCAALAAETDYVLLLNPDVEPETDFAEVLLREMDARSDVAMASGKLLRPDGRIDSAGIHLPRHRRPRDRGSEERDDGQYDRIEHVFSVSGAAMMLRRAALDRLAVAGEVFDEDFFAYHEDTDLGWRANLLGWSALYVPEARALHRRGWQRGSWRKVAPAVRRHSFKNHYLEMIKNERPRAFARDLPVILAWEVLRLGYAVLRDPARLPAYASAARLAPRAWRKRRLIQRRAAAARGPLVRRTAPRIPAATSPPRAAATEETP